ncbi:unnamed protein product [Clonostachys byssicola]|uniref:Uncharacterized protein n=1 Tax=Clonostachys byssicola TaxID=160290 RepID=A0A9N9UU83_9HYPO|nr:unnamed protein product [Clonostachys byssicola]
MYPSAVLCIPITILKLCVGILSIVESIVIWKFNARIWTLDFVITHHFWADLIIFECVFDSGVWIFLLVTWFSSDNTIDNVKGVLCIIVDFTNI